MAVLERLAIASAPCPEEVKWCPAHTAVTERERKNREFSSQCGTILDDAGVLGAGASAKPP